VSNIIRVCFFSSGAASWLSAKRVSEKFGTDNLFLVFADTGIEDPDNYRFLLESAANVGGELIWLKDGRNPWDVFFEKRFINHRQSACSIELKVKPCRQWIKDNQLKPENTVLYFGIGFEEIERLKSISKHWSPFKVDAPLCWDDYGWADRAEIMKALKREGIKRPRLYDLGFSHANCGGFCPKAGLSHYRNLLKTLPDVYRFHEDQEQKFLADIDRQDVAILRKTVDGETIPTTLKQWREAIESEPMQLDIWGESLGGCGCFIEEASND
jgi:hypothetical protein